MLLNKIEDYLTEEELDGVRCRPNNEEKFTSRMNWHQMIIGHLNYDR